MGENTSRKGVGMKFFEKISGITCPYCGADMREDIPIEYFENGGI